MQCNAGSLAKKLRASNAIYIVPTSNIKVLFFRPMRNAEWNFFLFRPAQRIQSGKLCGFTTKSRKRLQCHIPLFGLYTKCAKKKRVEKCGGSVFSLLLFPTTQVCFSGAPLFEVLQGRLVFFNGYFWAKETASFTVLKAKTHKCVPFFSLPFFFINTMLSNGSAHIYAHF